MSRRIAEIALAYMAEHGHECLVWGDGGLVSIARRAGMEHEHPLDAMQKVVNALARAPKHFETFHFLGCDSRARRRICRAFRPIAPRPIPSPFSPAGQRSPMPDSPEPAASLLSEALTFLAAHGIDVVLNSDGGRWRFDMDGTAVTEGGLVAKACALGMLKVTAIQ